MTFVHMSFCYRVEQFLGHPIMYYDFPKCLRVHDVKCFLVVNKVDELRLGPFDGLFYYMIRNDSRWSEHIYHV